jgi:hypothetical protein
MLVVASTKVGGGLEVLVPSEEFFVLIAVLIL